MTQGSLEPLTTVTTLFIGDSEVTFNDATKQRSLTRNHTTPSGVPIAAEDVVGGKNGVAGATEWTWLVADQQHSIRLSKGPRGVKRIAYLPHGTPLGYGNNPALAPGGRGYLNKTHDPNGDIRLDQRAYRPGLNILTTPDPLMVSFDPQSLNPYAYARNNPIGLSDPSGLYIKSAGGGCMYTCTTSPSPEAQQALYDGTPGPGGAEAAQVLGVFSTIASDSWDVVHGLGSSVAHPIQTAKSLGNSALHPISTVKQAVRSVVDPVRSSWSDGQYGDAIGHGIFGLVSVVAGTKGAFAGVRAAKGRYRRSSPDMETPQAPTTGKRRGVDRGDGRDDYGHFTGEGGYGAAGEAHGLIEYTALTGQAVVSDTVRATLPDGSTRYYDGLSLMEDGSYQGVEVKSGTASLNAQQRAFDDQVDGGTPATATLRGERITITSTYLIKVKAE